MSDLKLVVSTHAHPDHSGGLAGFKKLGIPIAGPEDLSSWYGGVSGFFTYWVDILLTYMVALNKKRGFKNIIFKRRVKLDHPLKDGDLIPGFENWQALHCPGHTGMDLSLYNESQKIAYVADNFVGIKTKVFRPYPIIYPEKYKVSLQRYIDLGLEDFLIAHHGQVKVSHKRIKQLIETTPNQARKHTNTLPLIFMKLFKSLMRKVF
jgi:glyoxylase-like metal-dependent hydrolase (beta-lactamase superfamily II)